MPKILCRIRSLRSGKFRFGHDWSADDELDSVGSDASGGSLSAFGRNYSLAQYQSDRLDWNLSSQHGPLLQNFIYRRNCAI